jgi:predicted ATPase/class 3 adenylate cyclase
LNTILPGGTVTFLFTDIEGSTRLWEMHPDAMKVALAQHYSVLRSAMAANHGQVIKTTGDGLHAVFASAAEGVAAVVMAQRALQAQVWPATCPLRVRMALHTGEAEMRDGDYYGAALNRAARLMAVGAGGQILVSNATAELIRDQLPVAVTLRDLGEHRLKDLIRPEHVFQIMAPDLPTHFPPLKSLNAFSHNLPVQLTSFVGREKEIAAAKQLLATTRLLTLTGPGGTGKTRLALQIAAEVLPDFPDGAWLVELAPLADPAYVLPALAAVFELRELPGRPLSVLVTDYLRGKTLLLLLDNCEHLIETCAQLADDLLHACPNVKIIVSSRESIGLSGETVYRVPSLTLPDAPAAALEALSQCEAVRLFVERAQAAQPRFALSANNAPAVAAICRRLDGIPLALELAASRVKVLSVEQIATRLDDRFRLLVGGSRTALPRQQTLRAMIDWSYDLLPKDERQELRLLSVFAGGWSLEAAEAVGASPDVLGVLAQLINKSLVTMDEFDAQARYHLLETVRQYAREKLLEAAEGENVRNRHLDFFLHLTEAAEPKLIGSEMIACLDQLEVEQDNLRAALEWALEKNPLAALRLAAVLYMFWGRRTSLIEGLNWVVTALARAEAAPPQDEVAQSYLAARAKALAGQAALAFELGDNLAARAAVEASVSLARQIGASQTLAFALGMGATIFGFMNDVASARAWADECIALCRQFGFVFEMGMVSGPYVFLAIVGDQPVQPGMQEEILRAARASGNPWAIGRTILNAARLAVIRGNLAEAYARYEESAALFQHMRDRSFYNSSRSETGHVLRLQGRYPEALTVYSETIRVWQELGQSAAVAHELECFAFIAGTSGQNGRAARLFGAAEALRELIGTTMTPMERQEYDQALSQLREQMSEVQLQDTWTKGRAMGMDEAIHYALTEASD